MNRIEDRLRDAFGAAAETVRPDSVSGLHTRPFAGRTRRLAPLAAAAAVAAIVVAASVITPLALAGGNGHPPAATGGPSPTPAYGATVTTVPMVVGMSVSQATAVLNAAGLRVTAGGQIGNSLPAGTVITQTPAAGTRVPGGTMISLAVASGRGSETVTLAPPRLVTVSQYAVTIKVEQGWQPSSSPGPVRGYRGVDGFVQLSAIAEPGGLHAACATVARLPAYGSEPRITYRSIDGRPGCLIVPSGDAPAAFQPPGGPPLPTTSALVEYRIPLRGRDNFLLISTDPPHLQQIVGSVQLHH